MTRRPALLLGLAGLLLACDSRSRPAVPVPQAPEVEYDGCWAVYLPGPVCALKPDLNFRLWVKNDSGLKVEIRAGDRLENVEGERVGAGRRFALSLPPDVSPLTVRLCQPGGACGPSWSLALAPPEAPAWLDRISQLSKSRRTQARRQLEQLQISSPAREKGLIFHMLSFLAPDGEANDYLEKGIVADRAVGNLKGEVDKATRLARWDIAQAHFSAARQRLEDLRLPPAAPALAKYQVAFYQGLLAQRVGDYGTALDQLRQAAGLAEGAGLPPEFRWKAGQVLAGVLQEVGRSREASELFERLRAEPHPGADQPCDLGELSANEGWSRLLAREGGERTGDPIPILEEARSEYDKHSCAPEKRLNVRLNLALAHLQAARWSEAGRALEEARAFASSETPRLRLWRLDLEARAIMDRQPARALQLYDELAGEAERVVSLEGRFRATVGRARAHRALRQPSAALADFAAADRLIDEQSRHVPVHEGRDTLVGQRETATCEYLELLLAEGQPQRAFDLVRRDRSRLLYQLAIRDRLTRLEPAEQQKWDQALSRYQALRYAIDREAAAQWQLPLDQVDRARDRHTSQLARAQQELDRAVAGLGDFGDRGERNLSPPAKDEVILAYHPLPEGWAGFAASGRKVEISRFELPASLPAGQELSRLLLVPFQKTIGLAGRVRVLPFGSLQAVDFHELSFRRQAADRPSTSWSTASICRPVPRRHRPAGWWLSSSPILRRIRVICPRHRGRRTRSPPPSATGTAGPCGGWTVRTPPPRRFPARSQTPTSSTSPATEISPASRGGTAALPLADGSRLTLGDILTLRRVPRWVVLSACDAGSSSREAPGEGIGLAHAFLLAGAQAVIAATRQVEDQTARGLLGELYRDWQPGTDLSRQLQRAEIACHRQNPKADCASFRLIEP